MAKKRTTKPKSPSQTDPRAIRAAQVKKDTQDWVRTKADEKAVAAGMVFDAARGQYVCDWIEENCYLYEGAGAGQPLKLIPYQREFVMRLFSWVYFSEDWGEYIRRFNEATLLASKKNGKSPFLAALALYLTCADGELGQKVYVAAKNGKQAQISQQHAIAMVEQSPNLDQVRGGACKINKTTFQIEHVETRSRMMILSGDDSRGAQQNEGINGSVFIDELHVFDREMHERTSRAGRSRKEPINLAVSTAGDNPSSYGYERTEKGRAVNEGKRDNLHMLHVEYAAPQKATDEDIAKNFEAYTRAANPGLGYTVKMGPLRQDYEDSKDNPREMARVKQYNFNMWIGSTSPWLSERNWALGKRAFTLADLRGRDARLGIDLSRTRDMTSAVLNFEYPEEGEEALRLYPFFWLPRARVELLRNLFPYHEWAENGELSITEGNVVDYTAVENELCAAIEEFDICVTDIYFDQTYAEEFTQRLEERLNCNRTAVSQSLMTLSPLAKEFERRVDKGCIEHPGNRVLDWQVGHVQVWTDRNQNIRPVKPDPMSGKSIDGIMATLNTFAGIIGSEATEGDVGVSIL